MQCRSPARDRVEPADPGRGEARQVAVPVDVLDLGELVVVDDREAEHHLTAVRGRRGEQVLVRADRDAEAGDELLADRVQRRVGDLGEELAEVVEQQPRPGREDRDRGVGAHRADRLGAGPGHRGQQQPQLLLGVAEGLLAPGDAGVGVDHVLALGQVGEVQLAGVQPVVVRRLGGELGLDLGVVDDPAAVGVHEEHPARLQPALADHGGRVQVQHPDLAGQDDQAVLGHPVAAGPQPVAVQDGTDQAAVGERDAGRAVPGLHQRRVEPVEGPAGRVHLGVVLPRLRDHHQDRVRQGPAAEVQQLEHLVEGGRVAGPRRADGRQPGQVAGDHVAGQLALPGRHPVAVALDRVDLAVVRDQPVRVGERPGRERVGGEPRVHQGELGDVPAVGEVREERLQLGRGEHALVDDRAGRQGREVGAGLALGPLAQAEGHPLQRQAEHAAGR